MVKNILKSVFISRFFPAKLRQRPLLNYQGYLDSNSLPLLKPGVKVYQENGFYKHKDWLPSGVTAQFLNDANTYQERYFDRLDFQLLIERVLNLAEVDRNYSLSVLDIGSGGGSSVFALAKSLPNATVVASDISPQLLGYLANFIDNKDEFKSRISAYCFDIHLLFSKMRCLI